MATSRPRRTAISGARAQFCGVDADVVNVSRTGALIHGPQRQAIGASGPLTLELEGTPIKLTAKVVRCEPVAGPLSTSTGKYAVAVTFLDQAPENEARLEQVFKTGGGRELETRRLQVSLVRRCPKCHSRDVAKEARRSYSCCQCGQVFTGFRLGPFRFSR